MLIIRLSALGDVAMTLPAIYSLAEQYPSLDIHVLTRPFFAKLFINAPTNVEVIGADFKGEYKGIRGMTRLLRRLARLHPDCVADLHNVLRSWTIDTFFRLRGVKVAMVRKQRASRRKLLRNHTPQTNFVDRYAQVFAKLGYPIHLTFRSIFPDGAPGSPMEIQHPAIGIAPFARYANKTYPPDRMFRAVRLLASQGYHIYLFGGRGDEAETLGKWASEVSCCTSLAGQFPITDELAIMAHMDAMITMDSANQHLAALTGTRVVSIWGSTAPICGFLAYGQNPADTICMNLPCQPCSVAGMPECPLGHFDCMNRITPQAIADKIHGIVPPPLQQQNTPS